MSKFLKLFSVLVFSVLLLQGCSRDEITGPGPGPGIDRGVYILSEGNGSPTSVALSYYNITDSMFTQDLLSGTIGSYPNGLIASGDQLFLSSQGNFGSPGKIYRLDLNGNIQQTSGDIGTNPYSIAESNNKLYLTNGPAGNVSVVDKNSLSQITTIQVGVYPQEILAANGKVFVCNTSDVFNSVFDSTISVIDAVSDVVVAQIDVQRDPTSLARSNDGGLLIGCSGTNGYIYKVDPSTYAKLDSFLIPDGCTRDISVDTDSDDIYFITGSFPSYRIVKLNLTTRVITEVLPVGSLYYGLAYDSQSDKLFAAISPDFTNSGRLRVLSNGTTTDYTTGVAPRRLLIK